MLLGAYGYIMLKVISCCFLRLRESHIVEVEAWGRARDGGQPGLHVHTVRTNPAVVGHVTGSATYASFLSSLIGESFCFAEELVRLMLVIYYLGSSVVHLTMLSSCLCFTRELSEDGTTCCSLSMQHTQSDGV